MDDYNFPILIKLKPTIIHYQQLGIAAEDPSSSCLACTHPHTHERRELRPARNLPFSIPGYSVISGTQE
ncbi:hypothetical protein J6590_012707 [Homalodisca vitripennis]|nr:hypothetical protein J6590_012707 [Homalodisca vitripennis]